MTLLYQAVTADTVSIKKLVYNEAQGDITTYNNCHIMLVPSSTSPPGIFYKPNPSPLFQGRRGELERLKNYFKPRANGELSRRSLLLYGMGGIGKTQICLKFTEEAARQ